MKPREYVDLCRRLALAGLLLAALAPRPLRAASPAAELLYPTNDAVNVDLTLPFRWTEVPGAEAYFLVVGTTPGAMDVWGSGETRQASVLVPKSLPKGRTLYARVWTHFMYRVWSSADVRFTAGDPPAVPRNLAATYPNGEFPILWEGQEIRFSDGVTSVSFFQPLFGEERRCVNPGSPKVTGTRMAFARAGEYYLKINDRLSLKVLVLSVNEPISAAVVRLFDFCRANLLFDTCHDDVDAPFYADQAGFARAFFESSEPAALLCGPTHSMFMRIVTESLGLPARRPALVGTFRWSDEDCNVSIYGISHNPLEVYLPDQGKWALFDLNFGFLVKWLDASELTAFATVAGGPGTLGYMNFEAFTKLTVYTGGPTTRLCRSASVGEEPYPPVRLRVSGAPSSYYWRDAFRFYYGGAAYWGDTAFFQMPHGTEFLHGDFIWASLHTDSALELAARNWIESFGVRVTIVTPETLKALLEAGHRAEILREAWRDKVPPTVLAAGKP